MSICLVSICHGIGIELGGGGVFNWVSEGSIGPSNGTNTL